MLDNLFLLNKKFNKLIGEIYGSFSLKIILKPRSKFLMKFYDINSVVYLLNCSTFTTTNSILEV